MDEPTQGCKGFAPVIGVGPLPVTRLDSHKFNIPHNWWTDLDPFTADLETKVRAEIQRLARLIPPPPRGYVWTFTTYRDEVLPDNSTTLFVRAELKGTKHGHGEAAG